VRIFKRFFVNYAVEIRNVERFFRDLG